MGIEPGVNKDDLYSVFTESVERNQKFANKVAHKALDVPMDDDMQITTTDNRTVNNYGGKMGGLAKMALAGALIASGVGAGFAIPMILDTLKGKTPTVNTDENTQYNFGLMK